MAQAREKIAELLYWQENGRDDWAKKHMKWSNASNELKEEMKIRADQILALEVVKGLTIAELIEAAEKAAEPIKGVITRVRRRPPLTFPPEYYEEVKDG